MFLLFCLIEESKKFVTKSATYILSIQEEKEYD